jgi:hypothetical protein
MASSRTRGLFPNSGKAIKPHISSCLCEVMLGPRAREHARALFLNARPGSDHDVVKEESIQLKFVNTILLT